MLALLVGSGAGRGGRQSWSLRTLNFISLKIQCSVPPASALVAVSPCLSATSREGLPCMVPFLLPRGNSAPLSDCQGTGDPWRLWGPTQVSPGVLTCPPAKLQESKCLQPAQDSPGQPLASLAGSALNTSLHPVSPFSHVSAPIVFPSLMRMPHRAAPGAVPEVQHTRCCLFLP